jgi:hypothetical protein
VQGIRSEAADGIRTLDLDSMGFVEEASTGLLKLTLALHVAWSD